MSVSSPGVKGETDLCWCCFLPPLFLLFLKLPCYLNFQTSSFDVHCWDFKRTLSTSAGVGFSEKARVCILLGESRGSHAFLPGSGGSSWEVGAGGHLAGPARPRRLLRRGSGCAAGLSPLPFKGCLRGSVFLQRAEERLSNRRVLSFH